MSTGPIAVIIELTGGHAVSASSRECLSMGRKIADTLGRELAAVVMGKSIGDASLEAGRLGTNTVYAVDHPLLEYYEPELYLAAFLQVFQTARPSGILMGHTLVSQDLTPRIAFALGGGLVTDCTEFRTEPGRIYFVKPVYSSNVIASFRVGSEPFLATVRSKAEDPAGYSAGEPGKMIPVAVKIDRSGISIEVIERIHIDQEGKHLQEADIIVAGGRGIGGPEGFGILRELAECLGGELGSSRPPCDMGWVSPSTQIGQTGEIVKPSLYIAVGISGSTQHIAGMAGSKTVIAINSDPEANIFRLADYGVIGDYREVIPPFMDSLHEKTSREDT